MFGFWEKAATFNFLKYQYPYLENQNKIFFSGFQIFIF